MSSIVLVNGYVVTVDSDRRVLPGGWIHINGDRITAVGSQDQKAPRADQVLDAQGNLVLPGFINGHNHHWASLFKNTGEGLLLEDWLDQILMPLKNHLTNEDLRIGAYLGAIEQIRTGTTCSLNHVVNENDAESMAAIVEPVIELGIRQLVTKELRDAPDPVFSSKYPPHSYARTLDEEMALAESLIDRWDGAGGVIHMGLALETGAKWLLRNLTSEDVIHAGVNLARRRNLKITNHCSAGTPWLSVREFRDVTGGGDVDYLVRIGELVENWTLAHCLWLTDREIRAVAEAGASVITNPVSNAYSCDGIAPLRQLFEAGVNVGLGSDGSYVNCSVDMVEQMKFAVLIQNVTHLDPTFMSPERAIEMATINAARALGLDEVIGSLEPGKRADVVVFDLNKVHTTVANRPISSLIFSAKGTDVDTVVVNGRILLLHGELAAFEGEADVLQEARARADQVIRRAGLEGRVAAGWRH